MKKVLAVLALAFLLTASARAATVALVGRQVLVTGVTASGGNSIIATTPNSLQANDWVAVRGVQGSPAVNGVRQCTSATASSCTVAVSIGSDTYTAGGSLVPLELRSTGTGPWFSTGNATRVVLLVWSVGGTASATVTIDGTTDPTATPSTPANVIATVTNPTVSGTLTTLGVGSSNALPPFVRVNVSSWSSGPIYATIDAWNGGTHINIAGIPAASPYATATVTPTFTVTGTPPTATSTPTDTPTSTPTNTPTDTPTATPTGTVTDTPTNTPTKTPTPTPTNTPATHTIQLKFSGNATGQSIAITDNGAALTTCVASAAPCNYTRTSGHTIKVTASGGENATLSGTGAASACSGFTCTFTLSSNSTVTASY